MTDQEHPLTQSVISFGGGSWRSALSCAHSVHLSLATSAEHRGALPSTAITAELRLRVLVETLGYGASFYVKCRVSGKQMGSLYIWKITVLHDDCPTRSRNTRTIGTEVSLSIGSPLIAQLLAAGPC